MRAVENQETPVIGPLGWPQSLVRKWRRWGPSGQGVVGEAADPVFPATGALVSSDAKRLYLLAYEKLKKATQGLTKGPRGGMP